MTVYGDISPRTAAYAAVGMLRRALPLLILEKFGQIRPIPKNKSKTIKFRRYEALPLATTPLTEGVTPSGSSLTHTDVEATLNQYGDFVPLTDVIADTHEDPVFQEVQGIIGEQAAQTIESIRFGVLKAGTNVYYANGVANRASVVAAISLTDQKRVIRGFKRQNVRPITQVTSSSVKYGTEPTESGYIALCHVDLENDIRGMTGFVHPKDYGSAMPYPGEIGQVNDVRYIQSTIFEPWADAGGANGALVGTTDPAVNIDVYPVLYLGADAYGIVPLKGEGAITPMVINPGKPSDSDPLGQRGKVGWKTMTTAVILNQLFMARLECGATDL